MFGKKKKDKKKKGTPTEKFLSLTANGVAMEAINFFLKKGEDGTPMLEVRTRDVCEAMHYSHVDFDLKTNIKQVKVSAEFKEAKEEKHCKLYIFTVTDYSQFFI